MGCPIVNSFTLTKENISSFKKNGFVVLRGFFSKSAINHIQDSINEYMHLLPEGQTGFKRVGYDIFENDPVIAEVLRNEIFCNTLTRLANRSLFYTQGLGFQIEKNKHTGFPWHIGTQSFGYIRGEDFGCSMWVPLNNIDPQGQGGGMSYVPENVISGSFMYSDIDPAIDNMMRSVAENEPDELDLQTYLELRHSVLNSSSISTLLEYFKCTDAFEIGDVFIFNKNVIHVSEPLLEGDTDTRTAFVMRFVDIESRYDLDRSKGLDFPEDYFGHPPSSDFHRRVCQKNGDYIRDSSIFSPDFPRTLIKE